jgi:CheY-like chemotaxis protein
MRYLFLDDNLVNQRPLVRALRNHEHEVFLSRDIGSAWKRIEEGGLFDLVIIDIALDRYSDEFRAEYHLVRQGLGEHGFYDLDMSGQALGLRLWRERQQLRQRYCYVSNHPHLWLSGLPKGNPEFDGKDRSSLQDVVMDKSSVWPSNVTKKFSSAYNVWENFQWLD